MSYYIQNFNVNDQSAYLTGVDISVKENKNTEQPVSCISLNKELNDINRHFGKYELKENYLYSFENNTGKFAKNSLWDCVVIKLLPNTTRLFIRNNTNSSIVYFSTEEVTSTYILSNSTGVVPSTAKTAVVNFKKENNSDGYDNLRIYMDTGVAYKTDLYNLLSDYKIYENSEVTTTYMLQNKKGARCIVCYLPQHTHKLDITGVVYNNISFFKDEPFNTANYIDKYSKVTYVHSSYKAKYAVITCYDENNPDGYDNLKIKFIDDLNPCLFDQNARIIYHKYMTVSSETDGYVFDILNSVDGSIYNDILVIQIQNTDIESIQVDGIRAKNYFAFYTHEPSVESFLFYNKPITKDVKCIAYNLRNYEDDYTKISIKIKYNYYNKQTFNSIVRNVPTSKQLLNEQEFLKGYILSSGELIPSPAAKLSNKLFLEHGKTYTGQGLLYYGTKNKIFFVCYNKKDEHIGTYSYVTEIQNEAHHGNCTFTFDSKNDTIHYVRAVVQHASYPYDPNVAQLEEGTEATEVVPYEGYEEIFIDNNISNKKTIKLLSVGNSYSQDAIAYVPYILQNIGIDVNIQIGILMQSSSSLQMHVNNFNNNAAEYYFYFYNNSIAWNNLGKITIQKALDDYNWDIICLQQSSQNAFTWDTYQPHCNNLIDLITSYVKYPVKFMWYQPQARPAISNSGENWSDDVITEHYLNTAEASRRIMEETVCQIIVPVGTAIQNARTIPSIKELGSYKDNSKNTSGFGYLTPNDGVHLQEGLPYQIAAYSFILTLLDYYGFKNHSILGESTRVTEEWAADKAIPSPHGDYIGSTDENCLIAQKCAIMAHKRPYQVTDMIVTGLVTE